MAEQQDRDQRTQEATPNRIRKAREEGQIGFSAELIGGLLLLVGVGFFAVFGYQFFESMAQSIVNRVTHFEAAIENREGIRNALAEEVTHIGLACLGLMIPLFVMALFAGVMQTQFNISFKPIEPKWNKFSIFSGFKRIFSSSSLVRGSLTIVKAIVIGALIYSIGRSQIPLMADAGEGTFQAMMFTMCGILISISIAIAATMTIVGVVDLAFQKWKNLQDLRMSMKDIRDEHKDLEGDPHLKARMKKLAGEMGRQRMLAAVPAADAIIRNPTHFAIAIKYDSDSMTAPTVVAKGRDFLAKRIIEIAEANNVPVVERKPVARFLYFNTKIGSQIPYELYQAVAEILNYVNQRKSRRSTG